MTIRKAFYLLLGLNVLALALAFLWGISMPDVVPTHWNASGQVDGRGPKAFILYLMPAIMCLNVVLMLALPRLSPRRFEIDGFQGAYASVWVVIQAMLLCLHVIFLQGARHENLDVTRWLMPVMLLFFALMGNWLGKIRQNFYMGIRTPWTLADSRVWDATHRFAGKLWFYGGLAGAVLCSLGLPFGFGLAILLALAFYPVYLSWAFYRKIVGGPS